MASKIKRSPEVQKRLDEFHKNIGQALVNNLNKATTDEKPPDVIRQSLGVPQDHPLASLIVQALADLTFEASWHDEADTTFRPYVAAILELRNAVRMSADERHALVQELCQKKRVTLLSEALGTRIPERVLQWSGHTAWQEFSRGDWNQFFNIALAEKRHSALAGVRTISRTLLKQILLIPESLRRKGLLNIVSRLEIPAHRWNSLAANFAKVDPGMRPGLLRMAARMEYRGEFWELYFRCEGKYWQPFRFPASLPHSDLLEPILSPLDMDAEALLMNNCLSTRSSRVLSGDRIYFRMRNKTAVDAELIRGPNGWVPGDILGPESAVVPDAIGTQIRNELLRMAHAITDVATDSIQADGYVGVHQQQARYIFSKEDIDTITQHLASIHGRSRSWTTGAYVIFETPHGGFVQYMCSPDGQEYLCEIQSYKYEIEAGEYLDSDAVDFIENAGFVWPMQKANFIRWFNSTSSAALQGIAEFTLAALHSLFHCRSVDQLDVKSHIPSATTDNNHDKFLIDSIKLEDVYTPICFSCKYWNGRSGHDNDKFRCVAYPHGIPIGIMNGNLDHHKNLPGDNGVHWEAAE